MGYCVLEDICKKNSTKNTFAKQKIEHICSKSNTKNTFAKQKIEHFS